LHLKETTFEKMYISAVLTGFFEILHFSLAKSAEM